MKYFLKIAGISLFVFFGCRQVTDSIKETLHPQQTAMQKRVEKKGVEKSEYEGPDIKKLIDSQVQVMTTMVEKHTSKHVEIHLGGESKKFLNNSLALKKAEEALRHLPQYAGKDIFIYEGIHFYDNGGINVMLRHPDNFKYVDKYSYKDGNWSKPLPVQLSARDDIGNRMISLDSVKFSNAFKVTKIYNEKALGVEGAKPTTYVYVSIWDKRMRWFPGIINGSRERYSIEFNSDGSLKRFSQD